MYANECVIANYQFVICGIVYFLMTLLDAFVPEKANDISTLKLDLLVNDVCLIENCI